MWNGQILIVALYLGTLVYGGHLVMSNRIDVSSFVSFILYQQRLGDIVDVRRVLFGHLIVITRCRIISVNEQRLRWSDESERCVGEII